MPTKKVEVEPVSNGEMHWWDHHREHPMSDGEFMDAFCEFVLTTTDDHSLKIVRNRAYRFIRGFMQQEYERQLSKYREVHG
jgi:hypothetical protein